MKSSSILSIAGQALLDCFFCWLSWMAAIMVFSYFTPSASPYLSAAIGISWVMIISSLVFCLLTGVYKALWNHPGLGSVLRLAVAVLFACFAVYIALFIKMRAWPNPGIAVIASYFMFSMALGVRVYRRIFKTISGFIDRYRGLPQNPSLAPLRTLIVGAGESASSFIMHTSRHGSRPREILGIVDSDYHKHGYSMHGVRVLGDDSKIPAIVRNLDIHEIIIAVPSITNDELRRIVKLTPVRQCKVRIITSLSGDKASDELRELNIGDLLGRAENIPDRGLIGGWIAGKTVMITGGGGSIGGEICRQLLAFDVKKIVVYEISENNGFNLKDELVATMGQQVRDIIDIRMGSVQDEARLNEVFAETKPHVVFHAAAYKHVPLMEDAPRLAFENNVIGTFRAARIACKHNAERFIMISTDKAVNPTSVMGATKRLAEMIVLGLDGHGCPPELCNHPENAERRVLQFSCVRFGNVLESNGSVIPTFKRQIAAGGPITLTHPDVIRYFMTMSEATQLVLEAGAMSKGGDIFILNMGEPVRIRDLAENLIRMAGLTPNVDINIEITGLRPGEKLYEELLLNEEGLTETLNDKIMVVRPPAPPRLHDIIQFILSYDNGTGLSESEIKKVLKQFIPEYATG